MPFGRRPAGLSRVMTEIGLLKKRHPMRGNIVATIVNAIQGYFIWAIVLSYGVAATLPQSGLWMRQVDLSAGGVHLPLLPAMLGLLLFNAGLGVPLRERIEFRRTPQKGGVLLAGMIGNLAARPRKGCRNA